jgi:hypothetical protein
MTHHVDVAIAQRVLAVVVLVANLVGHWRRQDGLEVVLFRARVVREVSDSGIARNHHQQHDAGEIENLEELVATI